VLRLRRSRGYAQHERKLFNVFTSPPLALSPSTKLRINSAQRSRRGRITERIANLMPLLSRKGRGDPHVHGSV
jgi:hypothetical protein